MATADPVAVKVGRELDSAAGEFVGVPWDTFERYFAAAWKPGQHVALIGPTGEGKSTFAVRVLAHRRWVMALDPKGGDSTLAASGFEKIFDWPLDEKTLDELAEGLPKRLIASGSVRTNGQLVKLKTLMARATEGVREQGGWTFYADEFQVLADRRMYGLDKEVELLLVAARDDGISVVTSYQAMAWVPRAATRQATWVGLWPTRDEDMIKSVARTMGRNWRVVMAAVKELPEYHCIVIPKKIHAPMIITSAPEL